MDTILFLFFFFCFLKKVDFLFVISDLCLECLREVNSVLLQWWVRKARRVLLQRLYSTDYIFISYWQGMFPVIRYMLSVFLGAMAYICMDGCMHCLVSSCTGVHLDLYTTCRAAPSLTVFLCSGLPGGENWQSICPPVSQAQETVESIDVSFLCRVQVHWPSLFVQKSDLWEAVMRLTRHCAHGSTMTNRDPTEGKFLKKMCREISLIISQLRAEPGEALNTTFELPR